MKALFHPAGKMSMRQGLFALAAGAGIAMAASLTTASAQTAQTGPNPWLGRWTVTEEADMTARSQPYRTLDLVSCGKQICGISVGTDGACGAELFRINGKRNDDNFMRRGRAQWGNNRKNLALFLIEGEPGVQDKMFELYIGDGRDFGGRSENLPKYYNAYRSVGAASCKGGKTKA